MFAQVIPILRLPRELGVFDYQIPDSLKVQLGSLVTVNFRGRTTLAVVERLSHSSTIATSRLKPINRVLSSQPILTAEQRVILSYVSREGFASPGTTLRSILPAFQMKQTLELAPLVQKKLPTRSQPTIRLLSYRYDDTKYQAIRSLIKNTYQTGRSVLIISPTRTSVAALTRSLSDVVVFDRDQVTTIFRQTYLEIRSAKKPITVIGTRSSVFAPVQSLGLIIIDDEDADELIQGEPNPRYDTRGVATVLARSAGADLIFLSRMPSIVTARSYGPTEALDPITPPKYLFIDLEQARRGGDFSLVTESAAKKITEVLSTGQRVLIVHPRSSDFGSLECRDCGLILTCPTCHVPLRVQNQQLVCRHCGIQQVLPSTCPNCRSVRLRGRGQGMSAVMKELAILVPSSKAGLDPADENSAVLVVPPTQLRQLPDRSFDAILITRYDSWLAVPRYDADERARRALHVLAAKLRTTGTLLLQASPPYSRVVNESLSDEWRKRWLAAAERFGYPPAWRILQLRRRQIPKSRSQSVDQVKSTLRRLDPSLRVTGPLASLARSRADQGGTQLLIRYRKALPPTVSAWLRTLDDGWTITLDPRELT